MVGFSAGHGVPHGTHMRYVEVLKQVPRAANTVRPGRILKNSEFRRGAWPEMFSGIVEEVGRVEKISRQGEAARLQVACAMGPELSLGESVCVNGVCLTVAEAYEGSFVASIMPETLRRSNLGDLREGSMVNLERALRPDSRLGGHIVLGHVDGVGTISKKERESGALVVTIKCPEELMKYVVEKGSIAVDGVSLTIAEVTGDRLKVSLVAYTLEHSTLGSLRVGSRVNIECDILGKYVERFLAPYLAEGGRSSDRYAGTHAGRGSGLERLLWLEEGGSF